MLCFYLTLICQNDILINKIIAYNVKQWHNNGIKSKLTETKWSLPTLRHPGIYLHRLTEFTKCSVSIAGFHAGVQTRDPQTPSRFICYWTITFTSL